MIFITHELPLLAATWPTGYRDVCPGEFAEVGTTQQVIFDSPSPLYQAAHGAMLSPSRDRKQKKPTAIEGAPPNLAKRCRVRFAERCPVRGRTAKPPRRSCAWLAGGK